MPEDKKDKIKIIQTKPIFSFLHTPKSNDPHSGNLQRDVCDFSALQNDNVVKFSFSKAQENSVDKPNYTLSQI